MHKEFFILLSFLIGLVCVGYLRSFDRHHQEPYAKMLAVTCWGGAWSVIVSFLLYGLLHRLGVRDLHNSLGALLVIGPVEEFAKLLALFSSYFIIKDNLDEPTDGIIYMACVALGFSLIENYFYAVGEAGAGYLLFVRLAIATPMHIAFSVFMGLAFYIWRKYAKPWTVFILPFAYAGIVHGLYDLVIFNGFALVILLAVMQSAHYFALALLSYTTAQSPHRVSLAGFIAAYPNPAREKGLECLHCGSLNPKETYRLKKLLVQKCDACEMYVTTKKGIFHIFHYFAATFRKLDRQYSMASAGGRRYSVLYSDNSVSDTKKLAFFDLGKLDKTVEKVNGAIIEKMEARSWFPKTFSAPEAPVEPIDYEKALIKGGVAVWRWLINPFSMDRNKKIHIPEDAGPAWNWGAFLIPEFWFLYHEIWGIFFMVAALYGSLVYASIYGVFNVFGKGMLVVLLVVRLLAGRSGNAIYFFRHGRWPVAAANRINRPVG